MKTCVFASFIALATCSAALAQDVITEKAEPIALADPIEFEEPKTSSLFASIDIASAAIEDDGEVINDSLVIQPGFGIQWEVLDTIDMELSVWANYATKRDEGMTQSHGFTKFEITLGASRDFDSGLEIGLAIETSQYPNMEDRNGEEALVLNVAQQIGLVAIGAEVKYFLTGDDNNNIEWIPFVKIEQDVTEDVTAGVKCELNYIWNEGSDTSAWTAYVLTARIDAFDFYAYASYWGQMSDSIYTDNMHDKENTVFGIGYAIEY